MKTKSDDISAIGLLGFLMLLAGLVLWSTSCSSGPQLPVTTPVVNIACNWHVGDGAVVEDNDCYIDRSSSEAHPETTGNETTTGDISPEVSVPVAP